MLRLGKNVGRYCGERIEIQEVLSKAGEAAAKNGWQTLPISTSRENATYRELTAFYRPALAAQRNLYISAGIHGDEPAGPLAAVELLQQNLWPDVLNIWVCPCLNPTGFALNTRENSDGFDLNRDFRHLRSQEIRAHVDWLKTKPHFDLVLCLHEDWEAGGFYVYELNPENRPSLAPVMVEEVSRVCPIDSSPEIDGWPARNGIIRPEETTRVREEWPESLFFLNTGKTRQTYTLEAPSDFPMQVRVRALVTAVQSGLEAWVKSPWPPR
jgi:hypothetical protein